MRRPVSSMSYSAPCSRAGRGTATGGGAALVADDVDHDEIATAQRSDAHGR